MQLDETDQKLLALLGDNARASVTTLANTLGVARTTVQARINRLEHTGTIAGYTLRPGQAMRPLLRATALVSIEPRSGPGRPGAPEVFARSRSCTHDIRPV